MTTDNRTNEPTPEQVEAVANAICEAFPHSGGGSKIVYEEAEYAARAALVAAQGAAPQTAKDIHEPNHDRVYCVRCGGNWPCQPAPVLPSSTVDEDALIREAKAEAWDQCEGRILEKLVGATEIMATLANAWPRNPYREETE